MCFPSVTILIEGHTNLWNHKMCHVIKCIISIHSFCMVNNSRNTKHILVYWHNGGPLSREPIGLVLGPCMYELCEMLFVPPAVSIMLERLWTRLMPFTTMLGGRSALEFLSWGTVDVTSGGMLLLSAVKTHNSTVIHLVNPCTCSIWNTTEQTGLKSQYPHWLVWIFVALFCPDQFIGS